MHPEAYGWVAECVARLGGELDGAHVVDIGGWCWEMWGPTASDLFKRSSMNPKGIASYTVLDPAIGELEGSGPHYVPAMVLAPAVDVRLFDELNLEALKPHRVDVIVCTETLEHTPPAPVLGTAALLARSGAALIVTCAAPARAPHTARGGGPPAAGEHYAGLTLGELAAAAAPFDWELVAGRRHPEGLEGAGIEPADSYAMFRYRGDVAPPAPRLEVPTDWSSPG